jgi:hypothetical protein
MTGQPWVSLLNPYYIIYFFFFFFKETLSSVHVKVKVTCKQLWLNFLGATIRQNQLRFRPKTPSDLQNHLHSVLPTHWFGRMCMFYCCKSCGGVYKKKCYPSERANPEHKTITADFFCSIHCATIYNQQMHWIDEAMNNDLKPQQPKDTTWVETEMR